MDKANTIALLITAISALAGAIIALVVYIKSIHKKHEERLTQMYKESLSMTGKMIEAINRNTDTINRNTDTTERNNITVNDLHKFIISQHKN